MLLRGMKFMFQLLTDGTVETLCKKFKHKGIPYGFGGIASLGKGTIPAEMIIMEHYRLGSSCAILSRSFCNVDDVKNLSKIKGIFDNGLRELRLFEQSCELKDEQSFVCNRNILKDSVQKVVDRL